MTEVPRAGHVLRYPYLWARQAQTGETEGRKPRPCAVILSISAKPGQTELRLCAITSQPPHANSRAVIVPTIEKRRAGLDTGINLWVILDEHNVDVFEQSYHVEPNSKIGVFSSAFTKALQTQMIEVLQARLGRSVKRT